MTEIDETTVFALASNASFQALGDGAVILMTDSGQLYTCNDSTEALLKMIDGQRDLGSIIDRLLGEYAVDRETLARDFRSIAGELRSEGIIEIRPLVP